MIIYIKDVHMGRTGPATANCDAAPSNKKTIANEKQILSPH
jgi:hypothetical protein